MAISIAPDLIEAEKAENFFFFYLESKHARTIKMQPCELCLPTFTEPLMPLHLWVALLAPELWNSATRKQPVNLTAELPSPFSLICISLIRKWHCLIDSVQPLKEKIRKKANVTEIRGSQVGGKGQDSEVRTNILRLPWCSWKSIQLRCPWHSFKCFENHMSFIFHAFVGKADYNDIEVINKFTSVLATICCPLLSN